MKDFLSFWKSDAVEYRGMVCETPVALSQEF